MVEITNREEARAFFDMHGSETCAIMGSRSVLRTLAYLNCENDDDFNALATPALRATLTAACVGLGRIEDGDWLKEAARSAADNYPGEIAGETVAVSAALSAYAAVCASYYPFPSRAAYAADSTALLGSGHFEEIFPAQPLFQALSADSTTIRFDLPLWPNGLLPQEIAHAHERLLKKMSDPNGPWLWWRDWYLGMWNGTPTDWDFALKVAKIDNEIWEQGPRAVADEIERLQAEYIDQTLPQVETVEADSNGNYVLKIQAADTTGLLDTALRQLTFILDQCVGSNSCSLTTMCMAYKLLRYTLDECRDDPNAVEANFRMARNMIVRKLDAQEYEREDAIETLVQVLEEGALQLRADHPDVAAAVDSRTARKLKELDEAKRLQLAVEFHGMEDGTAGRLRSDYRMDGEILEAEQSGEAQAEAIKRGASRASKISLAERAKSLEGSGMMSATKIALRAQKIIDIVMSLF
ncbi:MAG: hypothetical protein MK180_02160 [Rhodobacteraceae bacterium]|nr:hypothetical protein [Paracoccaceae bacterium]